MGVWKWYSLIRAVHEDKDVSAVFNEMCLGSLVDKEAVQYTSIWVWSSKARSVVWCSLGICHAYWSCECYSRHWHFAQISVRSLLHFPLSGQQPHPSFLMVLYLEPNLVAYCFQVLQLLRLQAPRAGRDWLFQCPWADLSQWSCGTGVQKLNSLASSWDKLRGVIHPPKLALKLYLGLVFPIPCNVSPLFY